MYKSKQAQEIICDKYPYLNDQQKKAIFNISGPNLIIAGPGTGKTFVLILRTLYIILSDKAKPSEIILTTFTEKAAFELRDRINQVGRNLELEKSLHELKIGTIHSICKIFINQYIHRTPLTSSFSTLDSLTQGMFINENFDKIVGSKKQKGYLNKWANKWGRNGVIQSLIVYFNKITEELIDYNKFLDDNDNLLKNIGQAYKSYRECLFESHKLDFAHLQKVFLDLLENRNISSTIKNNLKYIMIDEYQDTNFIQEKIALNLSKPENNICVVGDEDQSLYRFRGATVRNIFAFPKHFDNCKVINLFENYRSHKNIIERYNNFINSVNWQGVGEKYYRYPNKSVNPSSETISPDYPATFCIWSKSKKDEAERVVNLIKFLKNNNIIDDFSDVAILLKSVRTNHSGHYMEELSKNNIPYFCPRAKTYFYNKEVRQLLASFSIIFGLVGIELENSLISQELKDCITSLAKYINTPLSEYLRRKNVEIKNLKGNETLNMAIIDYFYELLAYKPFSSYIKNDNTARNLSIFSDLLNSFQIYYDVSIVTGKNKNSIRYNLFNSYFYSLINQGVDEFEDTNDPIPRGNVQIMTFHQSKGLEFPVVIVNSLHKRFSVRKQVDRKLSKYYKRDIFEPFSKRTEFDRTRHYYVAFSRAKKILVLSTPDNPKNYFSSIWEDLDQWPYVKKEALKAQAFESKPPFIPKKTLGLTSHINIYETCPLQYKFYKDLDFHPSRVGQLIFGSIVHQTIEDIHKYVLDGDIENLNYNKIKKIFNSNYQGFLMNGYRPLGKTQKELAFKQIITYFNNNKDLLKRVIETEIEVSIEKEDYIILGKIDLLLGKDDKLELLDFKSQPRPEYNDPLVEKYRKQLALYAHILNEKYGYKPERLLIYWTAEEKRKDALMELEYDWNIIKDAGIHFDSVASHIINKKFDMNYNPDTQKICKECDFRYYCNKEGIINFKGVLR